MLARHAADRGTAAPGFSLIAGQVRVVEIRTAGALKQVAGSGRFVAELTRGASQQRTRQQAIVAPHPRIRSERGIAHQCANSQAAIGRAFDLVEAKTINVNQMCRGLDPEFHQIEQICATRDEFGAIVAAHRRGSVGWRLARS